MLKSMTGYGKATGNFGNKTLIIELRSVNSKQFDMNLRIPAIYREKEIEIRNEISKQVERGKIDFYINIEQSDQESHVQINSAVLKDYFGQIKTIAAELKIPVSEQVMIAALRLPETFKTEAPVVTEEEWNLLFKCVNDALIIFNNFRMQEGKTMEIDIASRVALIEKYLLELQLYENNRLDRIKERLQKNLNEFIPASSIDANRFEQEVIYFLEKLDITEEKVRLKNHCDYFLTTMNMEESSGRKLGFIVQEMGREINTLGSKANDSEIQKLVVMMKDELEKIKEQLMNVL